MRERAMRESDLVATSTPTRKKKKKKNVDAEVEPHWKTSRKQQARSRFARDVSVEKKRAVERATMEKKRVEELEEAEQGGQFSQ